MTKHDCKDHTIWITSETLSCEECGKEFHFTELGEQPYHNIFGYENCNCESCEPTVEVTYP